jgi:hypothetical protein
MSLLPHTNEQDTMKILCLLVKVKSSGYDLYDRNGTLLQDT